MHQTRCLLLLAALCLAALTSAPAQNRPTTPFNRAANPTPLPRSTPLPPPPANRGGNSNYGQPVPKPAPKAPKLQPGHSGNLPLPGSPGATGKSSGYSNTQSPPKKIPLESRQKVQDTFTRHAGTAPRSTSVPSTKPGNAASQGAKSNSGSLSSGKNIPPVRNDFTRAATAQPALRSHFTKATAQQPPKPAEKSAVDQQLNRLTDIFNSKAPK
jgi:hypothetical protein